MVFYLITLGIFNSLKIEDTQIKEVKIIEPSVHKDSRGSFFETFKSTLFESYGLPNNFHQENQVRSKKDVLRGLHYQLSKPQGKLVQVVAGSILDVAVDVRVGSASFGKYHLVKLSSENKKIFYIPEGFAHGYLVLSEFSIVLYKCTNIYDPKDEHGIKWNDPDLNIKWGNKSPLLSEKDVMEAKRTSTRALFAQEYECEWTTTEAQIYEYLDDKKHINDYAESRYTEIIAGLDVGYRDENVFVVIGYDGESYYILDEYISKESTTSELASAIQEQIDRWNIETIYIDSAAQQVKADFAYDYDIYCENAIKSVNDGIACLQSLIENDNLYFDTMGGKHTYSAMSSYRWNPNTENPKPIHDWTSHPSDSVRYAIYTHSKMSGVSIYA